MDADLVPSISRTRLEYCDIDSDRDTVAIGSRSYMTHKELCPVPH